MPMPKILLVEDEPNLVQGICECLQTEAFEVMLASSLKAARDFYEKHKFDLVLLDWMLPDGQGIDLLKEIRQSDTRTPIVLLTARSHLVDKVIGLELGAQDYITKPFEPRELVARIRSLLRWSDAHKSTLGSMETAVELKAEVRGGIYVMRTNREVYYLQKPIELTKMEYELLILLFDSPNKVFSRDELLDKVWGYNAFPTTRTIDNHILQLRQKTHPDLFETVRGIGYRFRWQET